MTLLPKISMAVVCVGITTGLAVLCSQPVTQSQAMPTAIHHPIRSTK